MQELLSYGKMLVYSNNYLIWSNGSTLKAFSILNSETYQFKINGKDNTFIKSIDTNLDGLILVCTDDRVVSLFNLGNSGFSLIGSYGHSKRVSIALFSFYNDEVIVTDKFGDMYIIPKYKFIKMEQEVVTRNSEDYYSDNEAGNQDHLNIICPKMGHLSTITFAIRSLDNKLLYSGNKSGKVWISKLPDIQVTEAILCGHSDSISSICEVRLNSETFIVTASADKSIKIWDIEKCEDIDSLDLEDIPIYIEYIPSSCNLIVQLQNSKEILIISIGNDSNQNKKCVFFLRKSIIHIHLKDIPLYILVIDYTYMRTDFELCMQTSSLKNYYRDSDIVHVPGPWLWYIEVLGEYPKLPVPLNHLDHAEIGSFFKAHT
ncbi:hypothetical protein cand_025380 [Cryptosporidium andersoni]|uniref:Uncharacterized protein n=1 Tax=Cryptosporidium andersoni TaxID=117008 RepID=A0A1J4MA78_9CRYT|nr:hypothetical protein cand_025380 [Cryptosporidium andersoni]